MKKVTLLLGLAFSFFVGFGQYNPTLHTVTNKPLGIAQGVPTDARSYFYDATLFKYRPYQSATEVFEYLTLSKYRQGHFPVFINSTGTLSNGAITGGNVEEWWFKNGTLNSNLVIKTSPNSGGGIDTAKFVWVYTSDTTAHLTKNGERWTDDLRLTDSANLAKLAIINNNLTALQNTKLDKTQGITDFYERGDSGFVVKNGVEIYKYTRTIGQGADGNNFSNTLSFTSTASGVQLSQGRVGLAALTATIPVGTATTFGVLSGGKGTAVNSGVLSVEDSTFYITPLYGSPGNNGLKKTTPKDKISTVEALVNGVALRKGKGKLVFGDGTYTETFTQTADEIEYVGEGLPIIKGSKTVNNNWILASGKTKSYQQTFSLGNAQNGQVTGYSYPFVLQIDTVAYKTQPFSSRVPLRWVTTVDGVEAQEGTYTATNTNPTVITIHPYTNISPNNSLYNFDVTTADRAINARPSNNSQFQRNKFSRLYLMDFMSGYGAMPSGYFSDYDRIIFGYSTAHANVTGPGSVSNSVFLPAIPGTGTGAHVFYSDTAHHVWNRMSNTIFLDHGTAVGAHSSGGGGTNYAGVRLDNVWAWGVRGSFGEGFMFNQNTDTTIVTNSYATGFGSIISSNGVAPNAYFSNSIFLDLADGFAPVNPQNGKLFLNNCLITSNNYFLNNTEYYVNNCIVRVKNTYDYVMLNGGPTIYKKVIGNIFIDDLGGVAWGTTDNTNGPATDNDILDYNIYISLTGKQRWGATPNYGDDGPGINSFERWKYWSGQDQHSLFIDLSHEPKGLKAVFIDPENGNYNLVKGGWGDSIRVRKAGMLTPPSYFPKKPTQEQVVDIVRNGNIPLLSDIWSKNVQLPTFETTTFSQANDTTVSINTGSDRRDLIVGKNLPSVNTSTVKKLANEVSIAAYRNNFTGDLGMKITTGGDALIVSKLGRYVLPNSSATHTLKIVGIDNTVLSSTTIDNNGKPENQFVYSDITPIRLSPNTSYYIVSSEVDGGDNFSELAAIKTTSSIKINTGAYTSSPGVYSTYGGLNQSYGPVDFVFQYEPLLLKVASGTNGGTTADGSETKITQGTNVTVTGNGTTATPYVISSTATGGTTTTINNTLTSSETNEALSAAMGKRLKDSIDMHNQRLLDANIAIAGKLSTSGGQVTGPINFLPTATPTAPTSGYNLLATLAGGFGWQVSSGFVRELRMRGQTQNFIGYFQNKASYTFADSADVASKLNISDTADMLAQQASTLTPSLSNVINLLQVLPTGAGGLSTFGGIVQSTGTLTNGTITTGNVLTSRKRTIATSTATAGQNANIRTTASITRENGFKTQYRFNISALSTNSYGFWGQNSGSVITSTLSSAPSNYINFIGVGFQPGQTTLQVYGNDATGSPSVTDLGTNFPVSTTALYDVQLYTTANGVTYKVTRLDVPFVATGTLTDVPAVGFPMALMFQINNNTDAQAVGFQFYGATSY